MAVADLFTPPLAGLSPAAVALLELTPITAIVIAYWHRAMTLSWDDRPIPAWRQACFGSGIFLILAVLFSPWGFLAEELVIAHMVGNPGLRRRPSRPWRTRAQLHTV